MFYPCLCPALPWGLCFILLSSLTIRIVFEHEYHLCSHSQVLSWWSCLSKPYHEGHVCPSTIMRVMSHLTVQSQHEDHEEEQHGPQGWNRELGDSVGIGQEGQPRAWKYRNTRILHTCEHNNRRSSFVETVSGRFNSSEPQKRCLSNIQTIHRVWSKSTG